MSSSDSSAPVPVPPAPAEHPAPAAVSEPHPAPGAREHNPAQQPEQQQQQQQQQQSSEAASTESKAIAPLKASGSKVTKAKGKTQSASETKKKAATVAAAASASSSSSTGGESSAAKVSWNQRQAGLLPVPKILQVPGFVFGAGSNPTGELGAHPDEVQQKLKPAPVKGLEAVEIVDIACGGMHTMALSKDGKLYSWGNNDEKALGRSGAEYEPKPVEGLDGIHIVRVVCSDSASFALSDAGKVYGCGTFRDDNGVMGFSENVQNQGTMTELQTLKTKKIVQICCGPNSCTALANDGIVYTFGCGRQEAGSEKDGNATSVNLLGRGRWLRGRWRTLNAGAVNFGSKKNVGKIVKISSGTFHHFAISEKGDVYAWGLNNFGQTGIGHQKNIDEPTKIESLSKHKIVDLAAGSLHTLALSESGDIFSFGQGLEGQLGHGKEEEALLEPTRIKDFGAANPVIQVACGPQNSAAVTKDGRLFTWGSNLCGQLATGEEENENTPFHVKTKNRTVYKVSCGGQFAMILASERKEDAEE